MSGLINTEGSRSGVIRDIYNKKNNINTWSALYYSVGGQVTFVDNNTDPQVLATIGLDNTSSRNDLTRGIVPRFGNPVAIECSYNVARSYNGTTSYHMDVYVGGGGLGTGIVGGNAAATKAANTLVATETNKYCSDGTYKYYKWRVVDHHPRVGGAAPVYTIIRVGTPSVTYTFNNEAIAIYELKASAEPIVD